MRARRGLGLFAAVLAFAPTLVVAQVVVPSAASAADPAPVAAAKSPRFTPFTRTETTADGQMRLRTYASPAFRRTAGGTWAATSAELSDTGNAEQPFAARTAYRPIRLGANPARLVEIALDRGPVVLSTKDFARVTPTRAGSTVRYDGVAKDVDVEYEVGAASVKELLILRSAQAPRSFRFHLSDPAKQLGAVKADQAGGYVFSGIDGDGVSLSVDPAVAFEQPAAGELPEFQAGSATQSVVPAGDGFDITVAVDEAWLAGKSFPIVLDPSLRMTDAKSAADCWLRGGTGATTSYCFNSLVAGTVSGEPGRSVVRFPMADVAGSGARIDSATFRVYQTGNQNPCLGTTSTTCSQTVRLRAVSAGSRSDWQWNNSATWFRYRSDADPDPDNGLSPPSWAKVGVADGGGPGTQGTLSDDIGSFTAAYNSKTADRQFTTASFPALKTVLQRWANYGGASSNKGFHLRGYEASGAHQYLTFANSKGSDSTVWPYLDIYYTPRPWRPGPASAAAGDQSVKVNWSTPGNAAYAEISRYYVYTSRPDGTQFRTDCGLPADNSCVIGGLTNGVEYGFTVSALGGAGEGDKEPVGGHVPFGRPKAVTNLSANVDPAPGQAVLSWTVDTGIPGTANGRKIDSYTVTPVWVDDATGARTAEAAQTCSPSSTSCTITWLTNARKYVFQVRANNLAGAGDVAESPAARPYDRPDQAQGVTADTTPTAGSATVSWTAYKVNSTTAPSDRGRPVSKYRVRTYLASTGGFVKETDCGVPAEPKCAVGGLSNGTSYQFTVIADNQRGSSVESGKSAAATPYGAPGAPTNVAADVSAEPAKATVSFTPPTNDGGNTIKSYTVRAYTGSGSTRQLVSGTTVSPSPCKASPCVVAGLTNGTTYVFTVAAVNDRGETESAESAAVVPFGKPDAPTNVAADVTKAPGQATISWTVPKDNGRPITSYVVQTYAGSTREPVTTTTIDPSPCTASPCTVTGLTNGTSYVFTVAAVNARDEGPPSADSAAVTPYDRPGVPSELTVSDGDASATLSWAPPTSTNGSAVSSYTVKLLDAAGLQVGPDRKVLATEPRTATFTGLTNGATYSFQIYATNDRGNSDTVAAGPARPSRIPDAPALVTATASTDQVSVTWTPPTSDGGSPLLDYTVTLYRSGGTEQVGLPQTFTDTSAPAVFKVDNGLSYYATVTARNARGSSNPPGRSGDVIPYASVNPDKAIVAQQPSFSPGDLVEYTLTLNHRNVAAVPGVKVVDRPVAGLQIVGSTLTKNAICSTAGVSCAVTTDATGASVATITFEKLPTGSTTLTYTAQVLGGTRSCQSLSNTATVTGPVGDPTSDVVSLLACDAGLGLESWWSTVSAPVGPQSTLSVNVANGNTVVQATDSTPVQARGHLAYALRRTYNSSSRPTVTLPGSIGAGWTFNFGEVHDAAGISTAGSALVVPSLGSAFDTVDNPLAVTLADRDGTRHSFTPRAVAVMAAAASPAGSGVFEALTPAKTTLCVDVGYTAPKGVHLGLWRYVATSSSTCSLTAADSPVVVGFSAVRPDRLRTDYDATGRLLQMTDGNGVALRYLYGAATSGADADRLTAVYEPRSCPDAPDGVTRDTLPGGCRSFRFDYSNADPTATSPSVTVFDPADRKTVYELDKALPTSPTDPAAHLVRVVNDDGSAVQYRYGGCGGSADQLCQITDPRQATTTLAYAAAQDPVGSPARTARLTDRRGTAWTFSYPTGTQTVAEAGNASAGSAADKATPGRQQVFSGIDSDGRVALREDYDLTSGVRLHKTTFGWDSSACRQPDGKADNNLCAVQRYAAGKSTTGKDSTGEDVPDGTADERTEFLYTEQGMLLRQRQVLPAGTLDSTFGYSTQYVRSGGASLVVRDTVKGLGGHDFAATRDDGSFLFAVTDRIQSLTPRGNHLDAGTGWDRYLTSHLVDSKPDAPLFTEPSSGASCVTSGNETPVAQSNTGNVCQTSAPSATGSGPSVTRAVYDDFGQKTRTVSAKAIAETAPTAVPAGTSYRYFSDGDAATAATSAPVDVSGTVRIDGWLRDVTDPAGNFVAFDYDAAGNTVRIWDRDATSGRNPDNYPGPLTAVREDPSTAGVPAQHAGARYGTGATAFSRPWRYLRASSDPLGQRTELTVDDNGNVTTVRPPRGTAAAGGAGSDAFDVRRSYDAGDLLLTEATPLQWQASPATATRHSYDPFGNHTSTIAADTAGEKAGRRASVVRYDAVDRPTAALTSRGAPATAGADCTAATAEHAPLLLNEVFCRTSSSYDHVDNLTGSSDGNAVVTRMSYDAVHRLVATGTPRNNNGIAEVRTGTVYDPDGRPVTVCAPRHFTEGAGASTGTCGADAVFAVHSTYNDAGLPASATRYREAGQPLTTTAGYDSDGNLISGTDPRGVAEDGTDVTVRHSFDLLGRRTSSTVPRAGATRYLYSPSGDTIATAAPGTTEDNAGGPAARVTATSYDAAHRPVDTVQALQVSALTVEAVQQALAGAVTDAGKQVNLRSRVAYDADSNVIARYSPRAFTGDSQAGSTALLQAPDERFVARTGFDRDGRAVTQLTPRADGAAVNDPTGDASQRDQCRTGTDPYPAGVHVCRTDLGYDALGNVTSVKLPTRTSDIDTARVVTYQYTNDALLQAVLAPNPQTNTGTVTVTARTFDGVGRPVSSTNAAGHTSTTSYTSDGLVASVAGPTGRDGLTHITRARFNADGQPVVVETPRSTFEAGTGLKTGSDTPITVVGYYADGLTRSVTTGRTTSTTADSFPAVDLTISYGYDKAGNPLAVTSAAANAKEAPNPAGEPVRHSWTADNLLAAVTTPVQASATGVTQSRLTRHGYDPAGRKTSTSVELTGTAAGSGETSRSTQSFGYYPSDRLAQQTGRGSAGSITHGYDATGNPVSVADSTSGSTITGSFYLDGLAREVQADGRRTVYAYDGAGALATRADGPPGGTLIHTRFTRNHAGLPRDINADGGISSYGYNPLGQPTTLKRSNGHLQSWEYDPDDLLKSTRVTSGTGAELARWDYSYDELARIVSQSYSGKAAPAVSSDPGSGSGPAGNETDTLLPVAYRSTYDTAGRLASFTDARGTRTVKFDRNHNRLVYGEAGQPDPSSWTYRADDSIATSTSSDLLGGTTRTFAYAPFGGVTDDGCTRYSYDGFDRLASTGGSGCTSDTVTYGYDGLDRQIRRTSGSTTTLTYDGWSSAVTQQDSDAAGSSPLHYTLDAAGRAITAAKGSTREFLVDDGTGSIGLAVNADQSPRCVARYDAYGSPDGNSLLKPTGSCASGSSHNDTFYRGERRDGSTGNYQLGSRTYDPSKAGFLTPDSYRTGGSALNASVGVDPLTRNTYSYVNGDPLNLTDPNGHEPRPHHDRNYRDPNPNRNESLEYERGNQRAHADAVVRQEQQQARDARRARTAYKRGAGGQLLDSCVRANAGPVNVCAFAIRGIEGAYQTVKPVGAVLGVEDVQSCADEGAGCVLAGVGFLGGPVAKVVTRGISRVGKVATTVIGKVRRGPPPAEGGHGVSFFGADVAQYYKRADATLGAPGKPHFFMPAVDSAVVRSAADAARYTGMAPSARNAYVSGGDVYGIAFPTRGLSTSVPSAADAGGYAHFLEGGHTAVRAADPAGGYLINPTREFVTPGGLPVPEGSVLFRLGEAGAWVIERRF